jgi:hypothetical protein
LDDASCQNSRFQLRRKNGISINGHLIAFAMVNTLSNSSTKFHKLYIYIYLSRSIDRTFSPRHITAELGVLFSCSNDSITGTCWIIWWFTCQLPGKRLVCTSTHWRGGGWL